MKDPSLASTTGFGVLGPFFDIESLLFSFISIRKAFCGKGSAKKRWDGVLGAYADLQIAGSISYARKSVDFCFFIRAGKEKEPLTQPLLGVLILQLHVENLVLQPCLRPSMGVDFSGTKNTTFIVGGGNSS